MKFWKFLVPCLLFTAAAAFAEYLPPDGGEDFYEFVSPRFLAGGLDLTSKETPTADVFNPAAGGGTQRVTLDLSYLTLADLGGGGLGGHVVNLGAAYPTPAAVFSAQAQFLTMSALDLGTLLALRLAVSKDLFPDLYVGFGLSGMYGAKDVSDFGLAASLGFLHQPGDLGPFTDFRWGVSLLNLGKWYDPVDGRTSFPSPFTPAASFSFNALDAGDFKARAHATASLPAFQNLRLALGGELGFRDFIMLNAAVRADLRQIAGNALALRSFIPSFGLTFVFQTAFEDDTSYIARQGWNRSEVRTRVAAAPLYDNVWGFGGGINLPLGVIDGQPPVIRIEYPQTIHFSPNLDGVSDDIVIPLSITDSRYIVEYRLLIRDASGAVVRTIENKERRQENETLRSIVDRLLAVKTGIPIPPSLRWDGLSDSGGRAPDGIYTFTVEAADDNGNRAASEPRTIVVDATPPALDIARLHGAELIFSPNADGLKDSIVIPLSGSREDLWQASVLGADQQPVRNFTFRNEEPRELSWDGRNEAGELMGDGVYALVISSTDRAGNTTTRRLDNIIVNTESTPISFFIDKAFFSPNGDGVHDTVTLTPLIPVTAGIERWSVRVRDGAGNVVRSFGGARNAPLPIVFDGRGEAAARLPEGAYVAELSLLYENGNNPSAQTPPFVIDVTPPTARVSSGDAVFSPNGDGKKDDISFVQDGSEEDQWSGLVMAQDGRVVRTVTWRTVPDRTFVWNGQSEAGAVVPDGGYIYELRATDRAGNTGRSNRVSFEVNTEETPVILTAEFEAFSPNNDGVRDAIRLIPQLRVNEGIERYTLTVRSEAGRAVRTFSGRLRMEDSYRWDGLDGAGRPAADGSYTADLTVLYLNGNESTARTHSFFLDIRPPSISLGVENRLFSPEGDGSKDSVRIIQTSSEEALWEGGIRDSAGRVVRAFFWKDRAQSFEWDGTDNNGNPVPDGVYSYRAESRDRAGNRAVAELTGITIDTRRTPVFITASALGFSPNADGAFDTVTFNVLANVTDGLERWALVVRNQGTGQVVRSYGGTVLRSPMSITWDGRSEDGRIIEGLYVAEAELLYSKGNNPRVSTTPFVLDVSGPEVSLDISPLPFSPDNDGVNDDLNIRISVRDESPIRSWDLSIYDRTGVLFTRFGGASAPAQTIVWDGRSNTGELVLSAEDYASVLTISDEWGNRAERRGIIPIDILVIRDGDRFKIKISNINFAGNSPALIVDNTETGRKNREVIARLVDVLTKYSGHRVIIEGHANNISGTHREEIEELVPLSLARAESVKNALVAAGLSAARFSTQGKGGREMIFPFRDEANRWKNRRVEFILVR